MRNATKTSVSTFGVIMGLAGIEHGLGEMLQGSVAPSGLVFPSWPGSAFFQNVAGEPAMTILPNLLLTGSLAVFFSLIFAVWSIWFVQRKNGGWVLILLASAMLLTGGGIFPPVLGILIGILGTRIHSKPKLWQIHSLASFRQLLGRLWPWSFAASVIGWLSLFPGINLLGYFFGVNNPILTVALILCAFSTLLLTIFSGFACNAQGIHARS